MHYVQIKSSFFITFSRWIVCIEDICILNLNFFFSLLSPIIQQLVIYETSASELEIIRDISRTFPSHVFFQQRHGPGQRSLYNVLKAYSVYDREVGYVQVQIIQITCSHSSYQYEYLANVHSNVQGCQIAL